MATGAISNLPLNWIAERKQIIATRTGEFRREREQITLCEQGNRGYGKWKLQSYSSKNSAACVCCCLLPCVAVPLQHWLRVGGGRGREQADKETGHTTGHSKVRQVLIVGLSRLWLPRLVLPKRLIKEVTGAGAGKCLYHCCKPRRPLHPLRETWLSVTADFWAALAPAGSTEIPEWLKTQECIAAPQHWQAAKKKKKRKKKTSPAEVPQVMKPILSQGSEKHHILSSFAYSLPSLLPPMSQPVQHTKPIPQKTELSHYIFLLHLSKILQKENPELF